MGTKSSRDARSVISKPAAVVVLSSCSISKYHSVMQHDAGSSSLKSVQLHRLRGKKWGEERESALAEESGKGETDGGGSQAGYTREIFIGLLRDRVDNAG